MMDDLHSLCADLEQTSDEPQTATVEINVFTENMQHEGVKMKSSCS